MVTWLPAMRMPAPLRPMLPTKEQPKKVAVLANTSMAWLMAVRWLKVEFANVACDAASRDGDTHTHTHTHMQREIASATTTQHTNQWHHDS